MEPFQRIFGKSINARANLLVLKWLQLVKYYITNTISTNVLIWPSLLFQSFQYSAFYITCTLLFRIFLYMSLQMYRISHVGFNHIEKTFLAVQLKYLSGGLEPQTKIKQNKFSF